MFKKEKYAFYKIVFQNTFSHLLVFIGVSVVLLSISLSIFACQNASDNNSEDPDGKLPPAESIRVMSYNIRLDTPSDEGIYDWSQRKNAVAKMMEKYGADIVGLQEPRENQLDDLQQSLPEYIVFSGVGHDGGQDGEGFNAIVYRTDRFKLLESETFWLSETPNEPGSMGWDASYTRTVTWARFHDVETEQEFYVFNTHFDNRGDQARIESAKMLAKRLPELPEEIPVIITGDFNQAEDSEGYSIITGISRIQDARYASETDHSGPTATSTTSNWQELRSEESRIDYIFVSNEVRVLNHQVLSDHYHNIFPSDHLPVMSDIVLQCSY